MEIYDDAYSFGRQNLKRNETLHEHILRTHLTFLKDLSL